MRRPALTFAAAAAAGVVAAPGAAAQAPARADDLAVRFAQVPRLTLEVPVAIRASAAASYTATADVRVAGRSVGVARTSGRARVTETLATLRLGRSIRTRAATAARRRGVGPRIVVTVRATLDGRPGTAVRTLEAGLRRAPFYDGRLRLPGLPAATARRYAISWDLPFAFDQVHGAMTGTPSPGTFRKVVRSPAAGRACSITFSGSATTSSRPSRLPGAARERGRRGPWRFSRGDTMAVVSRRAPARLPGTRPWLNVRFAVDVLGEGCRAEVPRTVRAALQRAVRTVVVRYGPVQLGPGFAIA